MPTATPFTALGRGNGLPFCCLPVDIIDNPPDPSNNRYRWYDLCPETFTLEEVMGWFWNVSDYTSTAFRWGIYDTTENEWLSQYTFYLNLSEARSAFPNESIGENKAGVLYDGLGVIRDIEPYKRVCAELGGALIRFVRTSSINTGIRVRIVYDESNNNYRFIVLSSSYLYGTRKYVEGHSSSIGDTITLSLPITPSKNISIPMATGSSSTVEYRFISTTTGSLVSYTY